MRELIFNTLNRGLLWFYDNILPNPSKQNQITDHTLPILAITIILSAVPFIGFYLGFLPILFSLYDEFIRDKHKDDFFSNTLSGQDGRVDLFFRLLGCVIGLLLRK